MADNNARNRSAWTLAVAAQIRAERAASGMTQRQVMDASGIPKSTYLRMESGERVPDADQLASFTHALGLRMSEFFARVEVRAAALDPVEVELEAGLSGSGKRALQKAREELGGDAADPSGRANPDEDDGPVVARRTIGRSASA